MTVAPQKITSVFDTGKLKAESHHERKGSFSDVEKAFLSALLIDEPTTSNALSDNTNKQQDRFLSDEILFQIPQCLSEELAGEGMAVMLHQKPESSAERNIPKRPAVKKKPQDYRLHVGLWQAHEDGVAPKALSRMASVASSTKGDPENFDSTNVDETASCRSLNSEEGSSVVSLLGSESCLSMDEDTDESAMTHFDAWQVLKDEYAKDHGFDYRHDGSHFDDSESTHNQFKIIGTSADDKSSHPHVVSPPLLDAIMNHLPEHLRNQNFWMKYSLLRDGASLDTFKAYVRGAKDVILAIETTRGDVFGVYTSSPWRTCPTLYGGTPSFVWKMKYNRDFPCHSLLEQAALESEIEAYRFQERGVHFQMCTHDKIGVGVGSMNRYDSVGNMVESEWEEEKRNGKNFGYAVCLEDDLLSGTTSRSASFQSPCFVDSESSGEPFEVLNLEAWTLTPAFSEDSAEKLEMTQYFVSESIRSTARSTRSASSNDTFSSRDLDRQNFYRKIGHDDSHEELRDQWQLRRMLDGDGAGKRGMGASPRYS